MPVACTLNGIPAKRKHFNRERGVYAGACDVGFADVCFVWHRLWGLCDCEATKSIEEPNTMIFVPEVAL